MLLEVAVNIVVIASFWCVDCNGYDVSGLFADKGRWGACIFGSSRCNTLYRLSPPIFSI